MSIQHFQTVASQYSIVNNSNDSVTLRLMTEHDLAMLYEWLNRSHTSFSYVHLLGRTGTVLAKRFSAESVTPYIAMLNGEPIGYAQSYVALGSGDGWWEEETDPGVRGIDQSLAECITTGQRLGNQAGSSSG